MEPEESVVVITPAAPPEPEPEPEPELVDASDAPAVITEVPAVKVPETDAVEPGAPLAAETAPANGLSMV